ncbi:hypothetical protein SAMN05216436_103228 [bacterium A37T11]|nr:hypothetical protein SAMN05216436_103228 [bacterium A37T11]
MKEQLTTKYTQREGVLLRKVSDAGDYVDFLHDRVSSGWREWPDRLAWWLWPLLLPGILWLFLNAGPLLRRWDETAAVADIGLLSHVMLALLSGLLFWLLAIWLVIKFFPIIFQSLNTWQQCSIYLAAFLSLFWGWVVVLVGMV